MFSPWGPKHGWFLVGFPLRQAKRVPRDVFQHLGLGPLVATQVASAFLPGSPKSMEAGRLVQALLQLVRAPPLCRKEVRPCRPGALQRSRG